MKTAVLVFGMLREYDQAIPEWNLNDHLECDYYVSTWSKSIQKIDNFGPQTADNFKEFNVSEELIQTIFPACKSSILDEKEIFRHDAVTTAKMFFHWKNVYNLMLESGKKYDLVILTRPDVNVTIGNIFEWHPNQDTLYCDDLMKIRKTDPVQFPNEPFHFLCNDLFFCGSMEIFDKFMSTIPDMTQDKFKYEKWIPHISLAKFVLSVQIYPNDLHPFRIGYPVRPHPWQNSKTLI
jgi:hypothetical protein